jgi:DeoR/GlpR family transcriptional regulator of sugar metabolism
VSILSEDRKAVILEGLAREGKVMVITLAEQLNVSTETVRRDLLTLEREEKLKRVYGGAVQATFRNDEAPYTLRQKMHANEKKAIGMRAAELIEDGSTIIIDIGTTALELAKSIQGSKRLTILTNSLRVAASLLESISLERFTGKVILLGGEVNAEQHSISGTLCEQMMLQFRVDQAFLSVGGISLTHGITDYDVNEAAMSRIFASAAQEVIVLGDQSKLGISTFAHIVPIEQVDVIISDKSCPAEWLPVMEEKRVQWIEAGLPSHSSNRGEY